MNDKLPIDVCLSPELIHHYDLSGKVAVVVDILRATSCITAGIGSGVDHIIPFQKLDECEAMRKNGYLIAGERNGKKVEGFDLGNSPFSYIEAAKTGKPIAVTTTNGTVAVKISLAADEVMIGAFLNLQALKEALLRTFKPIVIVCAGWKGKVNLEDTLFAGALVNSLRENYEPSCDAPILAETAFLESRGDLIKALKNSSHVNRLTRFNIMEDIRYCLQMDKFSAVPVYRDDRIIAL